MSAFPFQKNPNQQSMEGRFIDTNGVDHGDREFHFDEVELDGMLEVEALERMQQSEVALIEKQLEDFSKVDRRVAERGYENLLKKYPDHPHAETWKEKIAK